MGSSKNQSFFLIENNSTCIEKGKEKEKGWGITKQHHHRTASRYGASFLVEKKCEPNRTKRNEKSEDTSSRVKFSTRRAEHAGP